jgi:hypothetical protein
MKNRPTDPSEIRALEFKAEFRRSAICSLPVTIGIDWSILGTFHEDGIISLTKKDRQQWQSAHSFLA